MNWLVQIGIWYFYLLAIGIVFTPITKRIFGRFYDFGYPFAKTIGILVMSYVVFLLGIFHILPFSRESLLFMAVIFAFIFYRKINWKNWRNWQSFFKIALFEEILFIVALIAHTFVRAQEPSIHGLEKFMDYGFMNSILRSSYFPPLDMWLSADPAKTGGYPINYYYFGHLTGAFMMKFSNIPPAVGYNLILATIFAQGVTLGFSFVSNIVYVFKKYVLKEKTVSRIVLVFYGLMGSFLINLAGNLHTIYLATKGYPNDNPVPFWGIFQSFGDITNTMKTANQDFFSAMVSNSKYWYPNATRFIPFTIHEFPSYSYVVADLHGHVFDIPFVLLTLALIFMFVVTKTIIQPFKISDQKDSKKLKNSTWISILILKLQIWREEINQDFTTNKITFFYILSFGFMSSIHYMTNAFDGPIYMLLLLILLFLMYGINIRFVVYSVILGGSFFIFSLPFSHFFKPFVSGIGVNCSPAFLVEMQKIGPFLFEKNNCQVSQLWMLFILWGFFWISAIVFIATLFLLNKRNNKSKNFIGITSIDQFILLLFAFGTFLIIIPEFFYIKDIYPAHFRANTMFKLGYQAFIMMSAASGFVLYRIKSVKSGWAHVMKFVYGLIFILVFLYPFMAFPSYYPGLYDKKTYENAFNIFSNDPNRRAPNISGDTWLATQYPEDYEIINYLNTRITGQPVVLEAQGDSYTDYERISAYTGLPTVAGWWVHEWLWRGSADIVGNRLGDITNMYESPNYQLTATLLKKYNVSYVVVSGLEKSKYPNLDEDKFNKLGGKIFESNNKRGALYQIK